MKTKLLALALILVASFGAQAAEANEVNPNVRAAQLLERVHEIRTMEFDEMSAEQKSEIKEELQGIRAELKELKSTKGLDSKVSISVGLIIIILLLLLLL